MWDYPGSLMASTFSSLLRKGNHSLYKKASLAHSQQFGGQSIVTLCIMPPRGPCRTRHICSWVVPLVSAAFNGLYTVGVCGMRVPYSGIYCVTGSLANLTFMSVRLQPTLCIRRRRIDFHVFNTNLSSVKCFPSFLATMAL